MIQRQLVAISVLAFFGVVGTNYAAADVAPPEDYVENCTVEKQQVNGKSCIACDSYYATVDKCSNEYAGQAYAQACKSWGASVWTEVWCKGGTSDGAAGAPSTNPSDENSASGGGGCAIAPAARWGGFALMLALLAALAGTVRRLRANRR